MSLEGGHFNNFVACSRSDCEGVLNRIVVLLASALWSGACHRPAAGHLTPLFRTVAALARSNVVFAFFARVRPALLGTGASTPAEKAMSWIDVLGYAASASVLGTFCMSTMIPLRIMALGSNLLFGTYGYFDHLYPVLILHAILLPVNLFRLVQFQKLISDVRDAHRQDLPIDSLLPYMTKRDAAAGETLVRKGEKADRLYYLCRGELEITDFGKTLRAGAIIGEIGVFDQSRQRTATIVCRSDCRLYELTESKAKQLYFQNRSFGFAILQLIINRLLENNRRLLESGEG